ncbi:MAG: GAP family protein [Christensenellales bacterium]|jgi:cytochrome c biogenesis protein CcdA
MLALLATTIVTSAADSLNPFAITQQFVLQGMVKNPRHIWYFIIPTGVTNLIGGFLVYLGVAALIGRYLETLLTAHRKPVFACVLLLGLSFLIALFFMLKKARKTKDSAEQARIETRAFNVSPASLVALGVAATISELATALPYFAFLAILVSHSLSAIELTAILVLYNFIYTLPLIVLYFIYAKARRQFDRLYAVVNRQVSKWSAIIAPTAVGLIGAFLVYHAIAQLAA